MSLTKEEEVDFLRQKIADAKAQLTAFESQLAEAGLRVDDKLPPVQALAKADLEQDCASKDSGHVTSGASTSPAKTATSLDKKFATLGLKTSQKAVARKIPLAQKQYMKRGPELEQENFETSPLLKLAAELRNRIFELVVVEEQAIPILVHREMNRWGRLESHDDKTSLNRAALRPALLRTSRQTRRGAIGFFYSLNTFEINMAENYYIGKVQSLNFGPVRSWLDRIGARYQRMMRIYVCVYKERKDPIDCASLLQSVTNCGYDGTIGPMCYGWNVKMEYQKLDCCCFGPKQRCHFRVVRDDAELSKRYKRLS